MTIFRGWKNKLFQKRNRENHFLRPLEQEKYPRENSKMSKNENQEKTRPNQPFCPFIEK